MVFEHVGLISHDLLELCFVMESRDVFITNRSFQKASTLEDLYGLESTLVCLISYLV
jgi:hypothetical protein